MAENSSETYKDYVKLASRDQLVAAVGSLSEIDKRIASEINQIFNVIQESETQLERQLLDLRKRKATLKNLFATKHNAQDGAAKNLIALLS